MEIPDRSSQIIQETEKYAANNYNPLPVVLVRGAGARVLDIDSNWYIDMVSSYSALNFGHLHPRLVSAAFNQLRKIAVTSRAFHNDRLGEFCRNLASFCGMNKILPMNTGAEAVETAIKISRKWGYKVKGVKPDKAEIIVCENNFHGRTITIISFSTEEQYKDGFGPFTPGFKVIPFGDAEALRESINENTVAFLVEPIQGEGGINIPRDGYLEEVNQICRNNKVLFVLDEIQTGFGRTGYDFAYQYEGEEAEPDVLILGKALGGGLLPISAVATTDRIMNVIKPGDHGSTFGGNPLACAVAIEAMKVLKEECLTIKSHAMGSYFLSRLKLIITESSYIKEVRGRGLMVGIELFPEAGGARHFCELLLEKKLLCKDTHGNVIRLTPPLVISKEEIDFALEAIQEVFTTPSFSRH